MIITHHHHRNRPEVTELDKALEAEGEKFEFQAEVSRCVPCGGMGTI